MTHRPMFSRIRIVAGVLVLIGLGLGLRLPSLLAIDEPSTEHTTVAPRLLPVETLAAEAHSAYRIMRAYTGQIEARRTAELGFERAGKLVTLAIDEGARVTAGTALATLDTQVLRTAQRELLAQRAQAVARLDEMRAGPRQETIAAARARVHELREEYALAQRQRSRRHNLWTKGIIAREEFDAADAALNTWQARLEAAQRHLDVHLAGTRREQIRAQEAQVEQLDARLATLALDLDKSVLRAPFGGTIAARLADDGMVITAGQTILRLVEDTDLEARVGVPPHAAALLAPGNLQQVQINRAVDTARVTAHLPELDPETRTVTVVLTLPDHARDTVVPGQIVRLLLEETVETPGFWLPLTALSKGERGLWSCFVLVREGDREPLRFRAQRSTVEILHTESNRAFVRGLLQPGALIVKNGIHRLVAGQLVRPVAPL